MNDYTNVLISLVTQIEFFDPSLLLYEEGPNGRGGLKKLNEVIGKLD